MFKKIIKGVSKKLSQVGKKIKPIFNVVTKPTVTVLGALGIKPASGFKKGAKAARDANTPPEVIDDDPAGVGSLLDPLAVPGEGDPAQRLAKRKAALMAQKRAGRQSTILTDKGF